MAVVGEASIVVRAITNKIKSDIEKAFKDAMPSVKKAGEDAGKAWGEGFGKTATPAVRDGLRDAMGDPTIQNDAKKSGRSAGESFNQGFKDRLDIAGAFGGGGGGGRGGFGGADDAADRSGGNAGFTWSRAFGKALDKGLSSKWASQAKAASAAFTSALATFNVMGPLIAVLAGGLSTVVSGLYAIVSAAAPAAGALAVLPGLLGAIVQGGGAVKLAFSGVGKAISAGMKTAMFSSAKTEKDLYGIADARKALARAVRDAARTEYDADRRVADAEGDLSDAHKDVLKVTRQLNVARKEAAEQLQQLAFDAEDAALAEQRASLNLEDAHAALVASQALPPDARARREAELSYKEAELALRQAKDRRADLAEEEKTAAKAGIEGAKPVIDAKNDIADAQEKVNDKEQAVQEAKLARDRAVIDSAERVADAQERLRRAMVDVGKGTGSAKTAADNYNTALANLSPQAASFVKYMVSLRGETLKLKAAAGEELFPKLESAIKPLVETTFPILQRELKTTGGIFGDYAKGVSRAITGSSDFETLLKSQNTTLGIFSDKTGDGTNTIEELTGIFLKLMLAIQPVTQRFAEWIKSVVEAKSATAGAEGGLTRMTDFFDRAGDRAALLGKIFGNLFGVIRRVSRAADPAGVGLLEDFNTYLEDLKKRLDDPGNMKRLEDFFNNVADNLRPLASSLGLVGKEFARLGENKGVGNFFKDIQPAIKNMGDVLQNMAGNGGGLAEFFNKMSELFLLFSDSVGFKIFFGIVNGVLGLLTKLLNNPVAHWFILIVGAVSVTSRTISFLGKTFGRVLRTIAGGFVSPLQKIRAFQGGNTKLQRALKDLKDKGIKQAVSGLLGMGKASDQAKSAIDRQIISDKKKRKALRELAAAADSASRALKNLRKQAEPARRSLQGLIKPADGRRMGQELMRGFTLGIESESSKVRKAMIRVVRAAIQGAKTELEIASPSRKAARLGQQTGQGYEGGLNSRTKSAYTAGKRMAQSAEAGARSVVIRPVVAPVAAAGGRAVRGAGGTAGLAAGAGAAAANTTRLSRATGGLGKAFGGLGRGVSGLLGGPLGMLFIAIPLLVLAFKKLYKASPEFKKFVDNLVKAVKPIVAAIGNFVVKVLGAFFRWVNDSMPKIKAVFSSVFGAISPILGTVRDVFVRVFSAVKDVMTNVFAKAVEIAPKVVQTAWGIIQPILGFLRAAFGVVVTAVKFYITNIFIPYWKMVWEAVQIAWGIIKPILGALWSLLKVVFEVVKFLIMNVVVPSFKVLWATVQVAWSILKPIFEALWEIVKLVFKGVKFYIDTFVLPAFKLLWSGLQTAWGIIQPILSFFWDLIKKVFQGIKSAWENFVKPAVNAMRDAFGALGDKIGSVVGGIKDKFTAVKTAIGDIRDTIKTKIEDIKNFFTSIPGAIAGAFKDLGKFAKDGINTFINFLNDKLIGTVNNVTKHFGLTIPPIKTFAEGGYTGPGSKYQPAGVVHADEFVINKGARRQIERAHPGALAVMNKTGTIPRSALPMGDWGPFGAIAGAAKSGVKGTVKVAKGAVDLAGDAWNSIENIAKSGVGKVLEKIINGAKGLLSGAGIKRGFFLFDLFYGVMDKIAESAKNWGDSKQADADKMAGAEAAKQAKAAGVGDVKVDTPTSPAGRMSWKGGTFTRLFVESLKKAEKLAGVGIIVTQGGFRPATSYSGTSHQGDAIDLQVSNALISALRRVGIAAGDRTGLGKWAPHVHAIPGPNAGYAAGSAIRQWQDYIRKGGAGQSFRSTWGLARGGLVHATPGGILANIGEGGRNERVEPLALDGFSSRDRAIIDLIQKSIESGGRGGGDTYHIHPAPGMNEAALAAMVSRRVAWRRSVGT